MNLIKMLGLDSNEIYGAVMILVGIFFFIYAYIHWRMNEAWKKDKETKTRFLDIWKPTTLIGVAIFILMGLGFWFGGNLLQMMREQYQTPPLP